MSDGASPSASPVTGRNLGLDYLRTVAIVIVLLNHGLIGLFIATGQVKWQGLTAYLSASAVISIEWLFVLSGFLIGTMMIRSFEQPGTWWARSRDFWLRRWFRTLPNYYLFLLVNALLVYWGVGEGVFDWTFLVFSQNLYRAEPVPHFFGESWSLAMDEWFYVLMPILIGLVMWLFRCGIKPAVFSASAVLIGFPLAMRYGHAVPEDFFAWDADIRRLTLYHLDATGWGVLAAALNRWRPTWWTTRRGIRAAQGCLLMLSGLAMVWLSIAGHWPDNALGRLINALCLSLMCCGTLLVLPWLTQVKIVSPTTQYVVEVTSLYSYSIYLAHFPVLFVVRHLLGLNASTSLLEMCFAVLLWVAAVYMLSALVFRWLEMPVSKLRSRVTKHVDASPFAK